MRNSKLSDSNKKTFNYRNHCEVDTLEISREAGQYSVNKHIIADKFLSQSNVYMWHNFSVCEKFIDGRK